MADELMSLNLKKKVNHKKKRRPDGQQKNSSKFMVLIIWKLMHIRLNVFYFDYYLLIQHLMIE